jgi:hypothetical protein
MLSSFRESTLLFMKSTASSATITRLVPREKRNVFHAPSEDVLPATWSLRAISKSKGGISITKSILPEESLARSAISALYREMAMSLKESA